MMSRPSRLAIALTCVLVADAAARQTPPQRPPVFRSGVEVVQLDVSVLGKDRRPVRGLTAADFSVFEDGAPQPIVAFDAIDIPVPPEPPARWMKTVTPDVTTNALDDRRLIVLVLDDALVPFEPKMMANAKQIARSVIDRLGPQDLASVVFTAGNRAAQDFTGDHVKLLAAVDKFTPGLATYAFGTDTVGAEPGGGGVNTDSTFYQFVVSTLRNVAEFLIEIPHRRKALIYVGPGVPVDFEQAGPMLVSGVGKGIADKEIMQRLGQEMNEIFRSAQRANLNISSIDPTGLGLEGFIQSRIGTKMAPDAAMTMAARASRLSQDFIQAAAANTGGRAVVNTEDVEPGITQIFQETGSYYLLGFRPTNTTRDGGLRRIQVKVNQPGLEVRARSGYYAEKAEPDAASRKPAPSALAKAMSGILPNPDLPMQVSLSPFVIPGQRDATVAIVLGVEQTIPAGSTAERVTENVELLTSAFTPEGSARGTKAQNAKVVIRAGAQGEAHYELLSRIDLKPGRYQLRLAANNKARERSGSVYADVEVPDFANAPVSLSGAVLNRTPGYIAAPGDALAAVVPIVPTAARAFMVTERVTSFLRVYQSGKQPLQAVPLSIRIVDGTDRTVVSETRTIGADRFVRSEAAAPELAVPVNPRGGMGRQPAPNTALASVGLPAADVLFLLPLNKLGPGPHVLIFEAGPAIRREVRFSIK